MNLTGLRSGVFQGFTFGQGTGNGVVTVVIMQYIGVAGSNCSLMANANMILMTGGELFCSANTHLKLGFPSRGFFRDTGDLVLNGGRLSCSTIFTDYNRITVMIPSVLSSDLDLGMTGTLIINAGLTIERPGDVSFKQGLTKFQIPVEFIESNVNFLGGKAEFTKNVTILRSVVRLGPVPGDGPPRFEGAVKCDESSEFYGTPFTVLKPDLCECFYCCQPVCFGRASLDAGVCSGNGTCRLDFECKGCPDSNRGQCCVDNGVCSCNPGYAGNNCQFPICFSIPSNETTVCSGRGQCIAPDTCTQCEKGWNDNSCQNPICEGTIPCNGRGTCIGPNICSKCDVGWTGNRCEIPICHGFSGNDSRVCNGAGFCQNSDNCTCIEGYGGVSCGLPICFNDTSTHENVCSKHGICTLPNQCNCTSQFSGIHCDTCKNGYSGDLCAIPSCFGKKSTDPEVCGASGACLLPNVCKCKAGAMDWRSL